jgi:hypothetical protein
MQTILNALFYVSLFFLVLSCTLVANSMGPQTCKCKRAILICVVMGCVGLILSVFYGLHRNFILASLLPINLGFALWFVLDRRQAHEEIDYFIERFKLIFNW